MAKENDVKKRNLRLLISKQVGEIIKDATELLGIQVPERM